MAVASGYNVLPQEGSMSGILAFGSPAWQAREAAASAGQNYTDPYGYTYNYSAQLGGTTPGAGGMPARETYPGTGSLNAYTQDALNYPTYMRNLGESLAQQQFQAAGRQMVAGDAAQQYQAALNQQNMARLGYMSQAGKAEADMAQQRQTLLNQMYGLNITQRGQDMGAYETMLRNQAMLQATEMRGGGGGGGGGGYRSLPRSGTALYEATGGQAGTPGTFTGFGGWGSTGTMSKGPSGNYESITWR